MYNILPSFLCLFLLMAQLLCYSQKYIPIPDGPRSEKNMLDEQGRRQGLWKFYYQHKGGIREEMNFLNNLPSGQDTKYFRGGKAYIEANYLAGRKDGEYKRYFFSGQVAVEGKYIFGKKDGPWMEYFEEGQTKSEKEYIKGKREGNWKVYNRKGDVIRDITYKNGVDVNAPPPLPKETVVANKKATKNLKYKVTGGKQETKKVK